MDKTYKQIVKEYSNLLKSVTHIPQKEVEILLLFILKQNLIWLHLNYDNICAIDTKNKLGILVKKRSTNFPLEYITKRVSFFGESFCIYEGILIPRPQTEILVQKAIDTIEENNLKNIVEIGTGSGIISIMLALECKDTIITAIDINPKALELAKENAIKHNVQDRITFIQSDLFSNCKEVNFDMCISNPPYISSSYKLPQNVKFEPPVALFGGDIGDELLKQIIDDTYKHNIKYLLCEMGYDQKKILNRYIKKLNPKTAYFYDDLEGFNRGFIVSFC